MKVGADWGSAWMFGVMGAWRRWWEGVRDRRGPGHKGLVGHARGQEHISDVSRGGLVEHPSFSTRLLFIRVWLVTFFMRCGSSEAPIA